MYKFRYLANNESLFHHVAYFNQQCIVYILYNLYPVVLRNLNNLNNRTSQIIKFFGGLFTSILIISCGGGGGGSSSNAPVLPSSATIQSFSLIGADNVNYDGTIVANNITIAMPNDALGSLVATFVTNNATSITVGSTPQISGETPNQFANNTPIVYTICNTANQCNNYNVTVLTTNNSIESFTLRDANNVSYHGTVTESNITITIPDAVGTNRMVATFTTNGAQVVLVNNESQSSGITANNFVVGTPVVYSVISFSGESRNYNVTVLNTSGLLTQAEKLVIGDDITAFDIAISTNGQYLYAVTTNGIITYKVNSNSSLESIAISAENLGTKQIALSNNGKFAAVFNEPSGVNESNNVSIYALNANSGQMLESSFANIDGGLTTIAISPDDSEVYVGDETRNRVLVYGVDTNNQLTLKNTISLTGNPAMIRPSNDGKFLYVLMSDEVDSIGNDTGISIINREQMTIESVIQFESDNKPMYMLISPDGSHAYITTASNSDFTNGKITVYNRDITTGMITPSTAPVLNTGINPVTMAFAANSHSLYVSNIMSSSISMYSLNVDGSLSYITDSNNQHSILSGGLNPIRVILDPQGKYLFTNNLFSRNIVSFNIIQ